MFVRSWDSLPKDPLYAVDLGALGFEINGQGQFVHKETGKFYDFFTTDNDRANDVRKEAIHKCAEQKVKEELRKYNVTEIFLSGRDGKDVSTGKPFTAHVNILASDVEALMKKSDVVVVIPDHNQDLGVLTYRELFGAGGIDSGSVLGLVKKLQETNLSGRDKKWQQKVKGRFETQEEGKTAFTEVLPSKHVPGIIVLNPGQLLYSCEAEMNMSFPGWRTKPKSDALEDPTTIDENHNRVAGHKDPQQHISTVLEHVIPQLTSAKARLWIIAVSDGAEKLVSYMDGRLSGLRKMIVPSRTVKAMALINSSHDPEQITNPLVELKLSTRGKSWVLSDYPLGTTLTMADPTTATTRDYEGEINSDPIAIPIPKKLRTVSDFPEVRVGKPGKTPQAALFKDTNSPRRRRGVTATADMDAQRFGYSVPLPTSYLGGAYPPSLTIPPLNVFKAKAPSDGFSEASPTDEEKERAEKEEREDEKLKYPILAKTPSSNDSHSDQSAAVSVASVEVQQPIPVRPFALQTGVAVSHPDSPTTSNTDFFYATGLQSTTSETAARAARVVYEIETQEPEYEYSPSEYSQDNDAAVYSSDSGVDVPQDDDAAAVYSNSGVDVPQDDSAKMAGGDFDDDDEDEDGLHLKKARRSAAPAGSVYEIETQEPEYEYSPSEYSQDDDFAVYSDSGVDVPQDDSAKMAGGDFDDDDNDEDGLHLKKARRSPPTPELEEDVCSESSLSSAGVPVVGAGGVQQALDDFYASESGSEGEGEQLGWDDETFTTLEEQIDTPSESENAVAESGPGSISNEWSSLVTPDSEVEGGSGLPEPEIGDMLRVSGGVGDEVELILPNAMEDVLTWFVAMSLKQQY